MAIRLSTIANRLITMMNAVIGPCVVAARNPTMPMAICGIAASAETPVGCATRDCRLSAVWQLRQGLLVAVSCLRADDTK